MNYVSQGYSSGYTVNDSKITVMHQLDVNDSITFNPKDDQKHIIEVPLLGRMRVVIPDFGVTTQSLVGRQSNYSDNEITLRVIIQSDVIDPDFSITKTFDFILFEDELNIYSNPDCNYAHPDYFAPPDTTKPTVNSTSTPTSNNVRFIVDKRGLLDRQIERIAVKEAKGKDTVFVVLQENGDMRQVQVVNSVATIFTKFNELIGLSQGIKTNKEAIANGIGSGMASLNSKSGDCINGFIIHRRQVW